MKKATYFLTAILLIPVAIIGYLAFTQEKKYYKISDFAPAEFVDMLKRNELDFKVEQDGSLWLNVNDEADYVACCT
ncbi:hypothetical protein QO009_004170 [Brevibacillus aydinogluensis]|jgi:hypothetical protein|uniref:Secreted protein n=1 Tax=Brevibacillus aydinogluensis TaxID=927786 RepID=A0AA48M6Z4_9BACL|nr:MULTISPECIES: hypothetical protein [Brevibacillus]MBR8661488.1 hypothetical protein [Brevibacillus sp. NL20B1]MDT3418236.1 hypothetical protein [Brevibacillus aydinogluensis]CAJ1001088.1 Secreted protein [Brevibacillus aydinogluensis]